MPESTSSFERLQSVYQKTYNRMVRSAFRDDLGDDASVNLPEVALRDSMLIDDQDSALEMILKIKLFEMFRREAFLGGKELIPLDELYSVPKAEYDESVVYRPQVVLTFIENKEIAEKDNRRQKTVRCSFRLTEFTSETIKQTDIDRLASAINLKFPPTYEYRTGRYKFSYRDKTNGLELIMTAYDERHATTLTEKLCDLRNVEFDVEKLTKSSSKRNWKKKDTVTILAKRYIKPEQRRVTYVKLKKAELKIHGIERDISLLWRPSVG